MTTAPTVASGSPAHGVIQDPLGRYSQKRHLTDDVTRLLATDPWTRDVALRMGNCATRLGLRWRPDLEGDAAWKLQAAHTCQARLCPFCEWRRTRAWRRRLIDGLGRFHKDYPTHKAIFLTFTVRNCELSELRSQIQELHTSFERMRKCAFFPTDLWFRRTEVTVRPFGEESPESGRARVPIEWDRLANGGYRDTRWQAHPHLHVLALVPASYFGKGYVKQAEWRAQWQMAARLDYAPVVDVRRATAKTGSHEPEDADVGASCEAAKYMAKATDLLKLGPLLPVMHEQLKGLRMIGVSRPLSQYVRPDEPDSLELTDAEDLALTDELGAYVVAHWDSIAATYRIES